MALTATSTRGWFIDGWAMFGLGVLAFQALEARRLTLAVPVLAAVALAGLLGGRHELASSAGAAALALTAGLRGGLERWLDVAPLRYLGRVSYSLFLIHGVFISPILNLANRYAPGSVSASVLAALAVVATVWVATHALHHLVEGPAMRLSRQMKRGAPSRPAGEQPPQAQAPAVERASVGGVG
jgi:peptidoglycan/LPS O-acetylase OafA/YrhL